MDVPFRKVTAIVGELRLAQIEEALTGVGVPGMSVTHVSGYGEYADYFKRPPLSRHARIEVFAESRQVPDIVNAILDAASTGLPGDGMIAVLPVEQLWSIRAREPIAARGAGEGDA